MRRESRSSRLGASGLITLTLIALLAACSSAGVPSDSGNPGPSGSESAEVVPEDCVNPPPDVTTLIEQDQPAACYGDADLTVDAHGVFLMGAIDCPGELEPAWFACGGQILELYALEAAAQPTGFILAARSPNLGPALSAVVHPASGIDLSRGLDASVAVTGHFDDPAARTCRYTSWPDSDPPPAAEVIQECRSRFVITAIELLDDTDDRPASDEPEPTGHGFAPHDIAQVLTTGLVVRSTPGVGPDSEMFDSTLNAPTLLYIFDGPVAADGYDWYQVMPSGLDYMSSGYGVGWVAAAGRDGEAWIGQAAPDCPVATTEALAALSGLARLACFGDAALEIEGDLFGCFTRDPVTSPAERWATVCQLSPFDCCPDVADYPIGIGVWMDPLPEWPLPYSLPLPTRVVGHFDDASADGCADVAREGAEPVPVGWGQFVCRTSFVATELVVIESPDDQ